MSFNFFLITLEKTHKNEVTDYPAFGLYCDSLYCLHDYIATYSAYNGNKNANAKP